MKLYLLIIIDFFFLFCYSVVKTNCARLHTRIYNIFYDPTITRNFCNSARASERETRTPVESKSPAEARYARATSARRRRRAYYTQGLLFRRCTSSQQFNYNGAAGEQENLPSAPATRDTPPTAAAAAAGIKFLWVIITIFQLPSFFYFFFYSLLFCAGYMRGGQC